MLYEFRTIHYCILAFQYLRSLYFNNTTYKTTTQPCPLGWGHLWSSGRFTSWYYQLKNIIMVCKKEKPKYATDKSLPRTHLSVYGCIYNLQFEHLTDYYNPKRFTVRKVIIIHQTQSHTNLGSESVTNWSPCNWSLNEHYRSIFGGEEIITIYNLSI